MTQPCLKKSVNASKKVGGKWSADGGFSPTAIYLAVNHSFVKAFMASATFKRNSEVPPLWGTTLIALGITACCRRSSRRAEWTNTSLCVPVLMKKDCRVTCFGGSQTT